MIAYVLSYRDLSIKDVLEYEGYTFNRDIEFAEKSTINVARKPEILLDDIVVCKDQNEILFVGICENYAAASGTSSYTITLQQQECLFDRQVIATAECGQMSDASVGIEGAIASLISAGWSASSDPLLARPYIQVTVATRTTTQLGIESIASAKDGILNVKTFLGNVLELYGIRAVFDFSVQGVLGITLEQDSRPALKMNAYDSDISSYQETLAVDALATLTVRWGVLVDGDVTSYQTRGYYLRNDRTVTQNASDPDRIEGKSRAIYIEAETSQEVDEEAYNEFKSNSYQHKISCALYKASKIYEEAAFTVGRPCTVRTRTGIQTTLVTGRAVNNTSNVVSLIFGKLKVTLIEKIRSKS